MRQPILVHGFPHSGTSILKSIIARHPDVTECVKETMLSSFVRGDRPLIKWPYTDERFFGEKYETYKKVFILRNPFYSFSSLNRRYGRANFERTKPQESIEAWDRTAQKWLSGPSRTHCILYEDLFSEQNLVDLFAFLDLSFDKGYLDTSDNANRIVPGVGYSGRKPLPTAHAEFRTWQINQPFRNMNEPTKLQLTEDQYDRLSSLESLRMLGYEAAPRNLCIDPPAR